MIKNKKILVSVAGLLFSSIYGITTLKEQAAYAYFSSNSLKRIKEHLENNKLNSELQEALIPLVSNKYKQQLDAQFNTVFKKHTDWVSAVAFSNNGRYSATGSRDGAVYLHDLATGDSNLIFEHNEHVISVAFGCNDTHLILALKSEIFIFDLTNNKVVKVLEGHTDDITSMAISADSQYVITGSQDRTARLWNVKTGNIVKILRHTACVTSVALNQDGNYVLTGTNNGTTYLWNITTSKTRIFKGHHQSISTAVLGNNGDYALIGLEDGTVRLLDMVTGENTILAKHTHEITSIAIDAEGQYALIASSDNAYVYNLKTGEIYATLAYHTNMVKSVALSQCGKYALTGSLDATAYLWNLDYVLNKISLKEIVKKLSLT